MTETPEAGPAPAVPEPTPIERVAQLAAEAAVRALPDHTEPIGQLQAAVAEILAALALAASPEGNAARLAARLEQAEQNIAKLTAAAGPEGPAARAAAELGGRLEQAEQTLTGLLAVPVMPADLPGRLEQAEQTLTGLLAAEPAPHPEQQRLIDDLRQKVANIERTKHAAS